MVDVATEPLTLRSYLQGATIVGKLIPLPTFGERIKLAQSLAFSMIELHSAGILHKSLHSANILFFPARLTKAITIAASFIGGFEISRPDQDGQLSIDVHGGSCSIYRHPALLDSSNELQGRPRFEIWQPLTSFYEESASPFEPARRIVDIARANLRHQMGSKYCEVVLECIDCEQLRLSKRKEKLPNAESKVDEDDDERGGVSVGLFIEKVIKRLEECHCRD